jgi:hypothetical protein
MSGTRRVKLRMAGAPHVVLGTIKLRTIDLRVGKVKALVLPDSASEKGVRRAELVINQYTRPDGLTEKSVMVFSDRTSPVYWRSVFPTFQPYQERVGERTCPDV